VLTTGVVIDGARFQGDLDETLRMRTELKAKAPAAITRNILLPKCSKKAF
jgi:hypothetical protein